VGISGISFAVPRNVINNYEYTEHFSRQEVEKVVDSIGIYKRRFADADTCSSDLCHAAALDMITNMDLDVSQIDALLFVSQTPDYRMPATSVILQHRLGLDSATIAMDITLGCSAFVYALQAAYSFLQNPGINKVLLLNGETRSKVYSPKDRKTAFIFGDAGAAVLVEKNKRFGDSYFSLNSDGSKSDMIKIDAGGYRQPSSPHGLKEKVVDAHGNIRNDEQGYMDGENVFSFVSKEVPKDLKRLFDFADIKMSAIDYFVFHQASKMINDHLVKKLKLEKEKVPSVLHKYGNTSSVSIPLTIASELKYKLTNQETVCLSAFGVGLSWGSAIINFHRCYLGDVTEV